MKKIMLIAAAGALAAAGCTTTDPDTGETVRSNTKTRALQGAAIGAAVGAITNTNKGEQAVKNAAIGAAVGAAIGGGIGAYQDRQAKQLREQLRGSGVEVARVGDNIVLNLPNGVTFDVDSTQIKSSFYGPLNNIASTLNQYVDTTVRVIGHTDSTGSDSYNLNLSQRRAQSVADYLGGQGVSAGRIIVTGMGEGQPVADNASAEGRAANRRVEIILEPRVS